MIVPDEKNQLTQYLLGQLNEADEETIELRLLSDPAFGEEFDIIVDEIAIRYASGGFEGKEKDQVERYFLRAPERQAKIKVMSELLHHSAITRGHGVKNETPAAESETRAQTDDSDPLPWFRRIFTKPLIPSLALTAAAVVIVAGIVFWRGPTTTNFATVTLAASEVERDPLVDETKPISLPAGTDELRLQLLLPSAQIKAKTYRAEFIPSSAGRNATVVSQDAQTVLVKVPAADLRRDRYAIRLFAINPDGREERIPGSYLFRVE